MTLSERAKNGKDLAAAFLLGCVLGIFCVVPTMAGRHGTFILRGDFRAQEIPVLMLAGQAIRRGDIFWNWHIDLGSDLIESLTYYGLGSPFTWVSYLFPPERMPYVTGFLFVLKYAVATVCAYAYIRRFVPSSSGNTDITGALPALCGALLYAFSGFQSINIYYGFFHDVVAFFPLLLLGYETLVHENRRGLFALAVMLNALVNYYFFIQEVLFLILYHFCREGFHPVKNRRAIARCFLEGVTGVLQAGILFVPALISTMRNPRTDSFINPLRFVLASARVSLFHVRSLLFPGELLDQPSCIMDYNYGSYSAYLPLLGMVLVIAYLLKHKTDRLSRLLYICLLCMFVPALNAVFNLMIESSATVQRWLYMMILMMALASSKVIAEPEAYPVRRVSLFYAGFILLLTAFMYLWHANRYEMIRDGRMFLVYTATGLAGTLLTAFLFRIRRTARTFRSLMLFCVSLFCVFTTLLCTMRYQVPAEEASQYLTQADLYRGLRVDDARYRFFSTDNLLAMGGGQKVTGSFLSTKNSSILAFYKTFMDEEIGQSSIRMNYSNDELKGIRPLLAGRYEISEAGLLTEDADTLPVGSVYDTYITESEFYAIPAKLRAMAMLKWIILADDETAAADGFLKHEEHISQIPETDDTWLQTLLRERETIGEPVTGPRSFTCTVQTKQPGFVFFSIPFSEGFRAYVDDAPVAITKSNHMMAVPVRAGTHTITFRYRNPFVIAGCVCSVAGWVLWGLLRGRLFFSALASDSERRC